MDAKHDPATLHYFMYRRVQQEMQLHLYNQNHHLAPPPPPLLPPNFYPTPAALYAGLNGDFYKSVVPTEVVPMEGQVEHRDKGRFLFKIFGLSLRWNVLGVF
jgi:hypothetical protein